MDIRLYHWCQCMAKLITWSSTLIVIVGYPLFITGHDTMQKSFPFMLLKQLWYKIWCLTQWKTKLFTFWQNDIFWISSLLMVLLIDALPSETTCTQLWEHHLIQGLHLSSQVKSTLLATMITVMLWQHPFTISQAGLFPIFF